VSKKTVPFSVPARGAGASHPSGVVIDAHSDDWVSDRHARGENRKAVAPSLLLDLAADRGLIEVFALSMLAPVALGFFWFINAMTGRVRL
jgi:hypothetical protein